MTITIAIANQKGGVGKTTTTINIAYGLCQQGKRVLIVDLDSQGHVAFSFGLPKAPGLQQVLLDGIPVNQVAIEARPGLDILPADKSSGEDLERRFRDMPHREDRFRKRLIPQEYDVVLFDTPPSFDVLHVTALDASDFALIPVRMGALDIDGVNELLRSIGEINNWRSETDRSALEYAIIPTFFDRVTKETAVQLHEMVKTFQDRVWPPIPQDTKVRESAAYCMTVWEYAPGSQAVSGTEVNGSGRVGGYAAVLARLMEQVL